MGNQAPYTPNYQNDIPASAAAVSSETIIIVAPVAGVITGATYTPAAAVAGAATNTRNLAFQNETQGLQIASLALAAGTNLTAFQSTAIPLSGTAVNLNVNAGDVLTFKSVYAGTGIADPGGQASITITASDTGAAQNVPYYETPAVYPTASDKIWPSPG